MSKINWTASRDGKYVDSGTIEAESDKDALEKVLNHLGERDDLKPDDCFSVKAGGLSTTSFGDEFQLSANVTARGLDGDTQLDGHHIQPKLSDVGIPVDTGAARDSWNIEVSPDEYLKQSRDEAKDRIREIMQRTGCDRPTAKKIWNEKRQGRRTFTPAEAAEHVKNVTGRDIECGCMPVWTEEEVGTLVGKLRCPAAPPGPNGGHTWKYLIGSLGAPGCLGHGHEQCSECHTHRPVRKWPKEMDRHYRTKQKADPVTRQRTKPTCTGRMPNLQNIPPPPTPMGDALRRPTADEVREAEKFHFAPGRLDPAGQRAADIMDKYVRQAQILRTKFAQENGIPIDQVEIEFINDEVKLKARD